MERFCLICDAELPTHRCQECDAELTEKECKDHDGLCETCERLMGE